MSLWLKQMRHFTGYCRGCVYTLYVEGKMPEKMKTFRFFFVIIYIYVYVCISFLSLFTNKWTLEIAKKCFVKNEKISPPGIELDH